MGLTDTIRNKVNSLFDFDSQQQSNQLKNKIDTLYGKQNTTTAPNINGYSNELSESGFAVKQKNGEYGTRNGITYGHFGTHQNSNGNNIVSYLPTGNATAILPNQDTAIEFMKQVENETSGYSIYLHNDNDGITKTGAKYHNL